MASSSSRRDSTMASRLQNATSITVKVLQDITDHFSEDRMIGEGAYGRVYVGMLENGEEIAVKVLHNRMSGIDDKQFQHEFENLMRLEHHNIVLLVGYCYETQHQPMQYEGKTIFAENTCRALCFEYMQNGSLKKHLAEEYDGLDWNTRYKIIKGTWEGLRYLHEGSIFHLDLKPENILLDKNMVPKLADFGLSRLLGAQQTMVTQSPIGTLGYLPMEYLHETLVSNKLDIFSMGVVMTQVIAGPKGHTRRAEMPYQDFLDEVQENWRNRLQVIWSSPEPLEAHCEQVNICTQIALSCMDEDRRERPNIEDIIDQLNGTEAVIDKALSYSANSHSGMLGDVVKLTSFTRSIAIPDAETCDEFPVLVRVTSPPWRRSLEGMTHTGLDVVVVINVYHGWESIIKEPMKMVIDKLGPNDRLSIVSFKGNDPSIMKLTFMSDQGHCVAEGMVDKLQGNYEQNMYIGLRQGAQILNGREEEEEEEEGNKSNRFGCIMLLSDRNDEVNQTHEINPEFQVHTFGLGSRHDPEIMKNIADRTSGTYSFIIDWNVDRMMEAMKLFISSITNITATSIKITVIAHEGITISSIVSGGYINRVSSDERSGQIDIDNICAGEHKNFIVYLKVAESACRKIVTISGRYQSLNNTSKQLADTDVFVLRPRSTCPPRQLAIHHEVAAELVWIRLVKGLSILIEPGKGVTEYSVEELWDTVRLSEEGHGAPEETMLELRNELAQIRKVSSYGYLNPKKVPYIMSWLSSHKWQRATTKGSCYNSGAFTLAQPGR